MLSKSIVLCRNGADIASYLRDDLWQKSNLVLCYSYSVGIRGLAVEYTPATRVTRVMFPGDAQSFC